MKAKAKKKRSVRKNKTLHDDAEWRITIVGKDGKKHSYIETCPVKIMHCSFARLPGIDIQSVTIEQLGDGS